MIQFEKSIQPVVLYEDYIIFVYMKTNEHFKNYKPVGDVEVVGY